MQQHATAPRTPRPSRRARQTMAFAAIQTHFPDFSFWHDGRRWNFKNWPTVSGRHASVAVINAHIDGSCRQRFDAPSDRAPRANLEVGYQLAAPYTSPS